LRNKHLELRLLAGVGLVAAATLSIPMEANAAAPSVAAIITGNLPSFASQSSVITVYAEPNMTQVQVGHSMTFTEIASQASSGGEFSVAIPASSQFSDLASAAGGTSLNILVEVVSGAEMTAETASIPTSASAPSSAAAGQSTTSPTIALSTFPASWTTSSPQEPSPSGGVTPETSIGGCNAILLSSSEQATRIGELHVAEATGMSAVYKYITTADSTLTSGVSSNNSTWSASGNVEVTNSIGTTGSLTGGEGYRWYVNSHVYYGDYEIISATCGNFYVTEAYDAVGDVFQGTNQPGSNPWGTCGADPNGKATISPHGGTYGTDSQTSIDYSAVASAFGFTFGGSTGYSTTNSILWTNSGSSATYACGSSTPNQSPVLYNSPS
jgi:hypothetical protein